MVPTFETITKEIADSVYDKISKNTYRDDVFKTDKDYKKLQHTEMHQFRKIPLVHHPNPHPTSYFPLLRQNINNLTWNLSNVSKFSSLLEWFIKYPSRITKVLYLTYNRKLSKHFHIFWEFLMFKSISLLPLALNSRYWCHLILTQLLPLWLLTSLCPTLLNTQTPLNFPLSKQHTSKAGVCNRLIVSIEFIFFKYYKCQVLQFQRIWASLHYRKFIAYCGPILKTKSAAMC